MLNITPIRGARARAYHLSLTSETAYYLEAAEAPAYWLGGGASALGLKDTVRVEDAAHVLAGRTPDGSRSLRQADPGDERRVRRDGTPYRRRDAWGLVFLAPPHVNALFAASDNPTREQVALSHRSAVERAFDYMERNYLIVRAGHAGARQMHAVGLAFASEHFTSRDGQALIHTHVGLANNALPSDGLWRAVESRPLYRAQHILNGVYMKALAEELEKRLGLVTVPTREWFEISGMRREVVEGLTGSRRREILATAKGDSPRAREIAAVNTRRPKDALPPFGELKRGWEEKARALGFDSRELVRRPLGESREPVRAEQEPPREKGPTLSALRKALVDEFVASTRGAVRRTSSDTTEPEHLPSGARTLELTESEAQRALSRLLTVVRSSGVDVRAVPPFEDLPILGRSRRGHIEVVRFLPPRLAFEVLVHEFAHELLHHRSPRVPIAPFMEFEAQAVANQVARALRIEPRASCLMPAQAAVLKALPSNDRVFRLAEHLVNEVNRLKWAREAAGRSQHIDAIVDWLRHKAAASGGRPSERRPVPSRRKPVAEPHLAAHEDRIARELVSARLHGIRHRVLENDRVPAIVTAAARRVADASSRFFFPVHRRLLVVSPTPEAFRGIEGRSVRVWSTQFFLDTAIRRRTHAQTLQAMSGLDPHWQPPQFTSLRGFIKYAERVKRSPKVKLAQGTLVILDDPESLTPAAQKLITDSARRSGWRLTLLHHAKGPHRVPPSVMPSPPAPPQRLARGR